MRPRIKEKSKTIPVNELYTAIQGEGSRAGRPIIMIRFSGCGHRCWFGEEGGFCDSWYSSIHPEKGKFSFNDIVALFQIESQIKEMIITGGSPTMFPREVNELMHFAHDNDIFVTMETEGGLPLETDYPIDLISLSPKFSNSIPKLGIETPMGKIVNEKFIAQHNKFRLNYEAIDQLLKFHKDYHYKPVFDGKMETLEEIENFRLEMGIPREKTWLMPAGDNRESLYKIYGKCIDTCVEMGYNFTGRPHIIAFDQARCV